MNSERETEASDLARATNELADVLFDASLEWATFYSRFTTNMGVSFSDYDGIDTRARIQRAVERIVADGRTALLVKAVQSAAEAHYHGPQADRLRSSAQTLADAQLVGKTSPPPSRHLERIDAPLVY